MGMVAEMIGGTGNLEAAWRFLTEINPSGIPKITPYQKPFYSVCLRCSKATFMDETSYESYLKSVIILIYLFAFSICFNID